ncbi:uncharacterized protein LOC116173479 isoform X1 [Photinus pyralis]|nr:uncharacterized protein LOC116173479 isoform X1 [Photinus pyralis]
MFMQILIEGIALQIGIQLAQSAFDRCSHGTKAFPYEPDFILEPQIAGTTEIIPFPECEFWTKSYELKGFSLATIRIKCAPECSKSCDISTWLGAFTVRALYAGTLVNFWTTAPSHQKRHSSSALLAAICFILATLTIASRCYASKNAAHPLAQFSSQPQPPSSVTIKDSKFQLHSSKIVLSRIFRLPSKDKQSDTRVILKNSKNLLSSVNFKDSNRKKREVEVDKTSKLYNTFRSYDGKPLRNENSVFYDIEIQSSTQSYSIEPFRPEPPLIPSRNLKKGHSVNYLTESNFVSKVTSENNSACNTSAKSSSVSGTLKIVHQEHDQNSELLAEETERPVGGIGIQRPMPPVVDHNSNSFSTESAILVLVVSAVVLTVALGLVTCVLSHYRGGTAADPHDAGHTPTTAP